VFVDRRLPACSKVGMKLLRGIADWARSKACGICPLPPVHLSTAYHSYQWPMLRRHSHRVATAVVTPSCPKHDRWPRQGRATVVVVQQAAEPLASKYRSVRVGRRWSSREQYVGETRPDARRERQVQRRRKAKPCQRTTVAGLTMIRTSRQRDHAREKATQKSLSVQRRGGRGRRR
jgi:hypothetical protein